MHQYLEQLDIINEQDDVIGHESRQKIHELGLLHREVHVWVYNKREIIFQRRGLHKDMYPDLLDASVGGHVDLGCDYTEVALKELNEETGIKASKKDLIFIGKLRKSEFDSNTGNTNNSIQAVYLYKLKTKDSPVVEAGKAVALEFWPVVKLFNLSIEEKTNFIPAIVDKELPFVLSSIV